MEQDHASFGLAYAQIVAQAGCELSFGITQTPWGRPREAAFASERVIVVVEELVDERVIRSDPNRTLIPAVIVSAVVVEPWGAHPSYAQGHYDRDNDFYVGWETISRERAELASYLDEFVYGVQDRTQYMEKQPRLMERLKAGEQRCAGVNYGF